MPRLSFTAHLAGIAPREDVEVAGATVIAALDAVFAQYPRLEGYVLDDQRRLRKHVVIFVDGERAPAQTVLQQPVSAGSEIYVLQALSGG